MEDENIIKARNKVKRKSELDISKKVYVDGETLEFMRRGLFDSKVVISLPSFYEEMSPEKAKRKYPYENRPKIILSNEKGTVNFTFSQQDSTISSSELSNCIQGFRLVMKKLHPTSVLSKCDQLKSKTAEEIHYFSYEISALNGIIYGIQFILILDEKLVMGGFTCPKDAKREWEILVFQILESIEILSSVQRKEENE